MSLSQAVLATVSVAEQLAHASEKIGMLEAKLQTTPLTEIEQTQLLEASLRIDGIDRAHSEQLALLYDQMHRLDLASELTFKRAHAQLLGDAPSAGNYRSTGMGVYRNSRLVHMTVPANQVTKLIRQVLPTNANLPFHPLLHVANLLFDLEYIQPFSSANGVIARLWVKAILRQWRPFLVNIPLETTLLEAQEDYYEALKQAIASNDNSQFIAFVLQQIAASVNALIQQLSPNLSSSRSETAVQHFSEMTRLNGSEKVSTREKLLRLLEQQPDWSAARAADVLGISSRAVEKHLSRLKRDGLLIREGSARAGRWVVTRPTTQQLSLPEY